MKERGAILLLSCYELGRPPLGVAYPNAWLKRAGYAPELVDLSLETLDTGKIARACLAAISVPMHTALRLGVRAAERIRVANPDCHICFYGLYAFLNAEYLLSASGSHPLADSVIGGECEEPLLGLAQSLESGASNSVPGVSRSGRIEPPYLRRLAYIAPDRAGLPPLERYARLEQESDVRLAGYVEASRGCKHLCRHCPIVPVYKGRFFAVPEKVVLEDVRGQVAAGATHISFADPDFLNGPTHALRVARALHRLYPDLTFDFTTKIEHILKQRPLFAEFAASGCLFITSAVESLSDTVLEHLDKGHTRADVHEALQVLRQAGIALRPSLVSFTPWTTLADFIEVLDFVEQEGLAYHVDPVHYAIRLLIPPGSPLAEYPAMRPHLGILDPKSFSYTWKHPDERMDRLQRDVMHLVGRSSEEREDPAWTVAKIRALACAQGGAPPYTAKPASRPPRLTESWFCCAEPTQGQFSNLKVL